MTKKIFIITVMLLLFININVYAGDIPESIMLGEQKALFIGKITSISNENDCITEDFMSPIIYLDKKQASGNNKINNGLRRSFLCRSLKWQLKE